MEAIGNNIQKFKYKQQYLEASRHDFLKYKISLKYLSISALV